MLSKRLRYRLGASARRGFTLVELVVVIIIVGSVAALSVPSVYTLIRNEREAENVRAIRHMFSAAKARAVGYGSAVQVRLGADGNFSVREATAGEAAGSCHTAQDLGCSRPDIWLSDARSRPLTGLNVTGPHAGLDGLRVIARDLEVSHVSLCFSSSGRTWAEVGPGIARPLTHEVSFLWTNRHNVEHRLVVFPSGVTRHIITSPVAP